jgi:Rps23 Pro-64 3,4-dihydroxylase Tpa1-like proline 4-hydroxylase
MLNQDLDLGALAEQYRREKRLRIENFLEAEVAGRIFQYCQESVEYRLVFSRDGQNVTIAMDELAKLPESKKKEMNLEIMNTGSKGEGFLYCGYQMGQAVNTDDEKLLFLHEVFDFFNGDELLSAIRTITGEASIVSADAQYTRFTAGHFLTRHRDVIAGKDRRVAYVFSATWGWHPDWGGLLQFYQEDGTPEDAWSPGFNTLSLFDTSYIHSVTYVTPFAQAPRLSLSGWFRGLAAPSVGREVWNIKSNLTP